MTEIEVKIRIGDVKAARERILALGAVVSRERRLEQDSLFDFDRPLAPRRRAGRSGCGRSGSGPPWPIKGEPQKSRSFKVREEF